MTMKIPYIHPRLAFDLSNGYGHHGAFGLFVYAPLLYGTGTTTVDYTIWVSFEDVQLSTPTYSAWVQ